VITPRLARNVGQGRPRHRRADREIVGEPMQKIIEKVLSTPAPAAVRAKSLPE
jgi:hypothetical protein